MQERSSWLVLWYESSTILPAESLHECFLYFTNQNLSKTYLFYGLYSEVHCSFLMTSFDVNYMGECFMPNFKIRVRNINWLEFFLPNLQNAGWGTVSSFKSITSIAVIFFLWREWQRNVWRATKLVELLPNMIHKNKWSIQTS